MRNSFYLSIGTALGSLALGACGGGGGANVAMEPGEWETTVEMTRIDTGNLPPELRSGFRAPSRRTETQRGCWPVSADVVRIQNLRFTIPERSMPGAGCTIPELVMEGGTLRGEMNCTGFPGPIANGTRQTMSFSSELDGSYTTDSVRATARGEVRFGASGGASGEVRITSRRIGACPPPRPYSPPPYVPMPNDMRGPRNMNGVIAVPPPVRTPGPPPAENALR